MIRAKIWCNHCERLFDIEVEWAHDLFGMTCPNCKGADIYYREVLDLDGDY